MAPDRKPPGPTVWRLAPTVRWLDRKTLAGGSPYRLIALTEQGGRTLRAVLGRSDLRPEPVVQELLDRLRTAGMLLAPAPPAAVQVAVTVVIPALSAPGPVARLLDRLPADTPVILVDDGSPDPLFRLEEGRPQVTVLRHPVSRGPGAARNTGAARVTTPWIAFLDADTDPEPDWIAQLKGRIDQSDAASPPGDRRTVLAAPRIFSLPAPGWGGWLEKRVGALDLGGVPGDVGVGEAVSYVPSAALLVDAQAFRRSGGFDESMRVGEDVDLVWRLAALGRCRYLPDVSVGHAARSSLRAALHRRVDYGTSAGDLGRRHPGSMHHVDVSVWSFVPWLLWVLVGPVWGVAAAGVTTAIAPWGMPQLPAARARKLARHGHVLAWGALGRWLVRPMAPATLVLGLARPSLRRRLTVAAAGGLAYLITLDVRSVRQSTGGRNWVAARTAGAALVARTLDDLAYSTGVWIGVFRFRCGTPVLPRVRDLATPWRRHGRAAG